MKTLTTLIAGVALATASTLVNATDAKPTTPSSPVVSFTTFSDQQAAIAEHQKMIVMQQRAFAEEHANAVRDAAEAQRRFAEQMAAAPRTSARCNRPVAPFAVPEIAGTPKPFELSELPAAADMAGLDPQSRRAAIRKFLEERREAVRRQSREQRDAAVQERHRYP